MNFRELCKIACVFLFLMCVQGNALAATIHGTVYEWETFKPLENTVVMINSTPEQSFVATNSEYSFNLTPGTYKITAYCFIDDNNQLNAEKEIVVSEAGEYVHDLLLTPTFPELPDQGNMENIELDIGETEPQSQANSQNTILIFALLALCVLLLAGYFWKKGKGNPPEKAAAFPEKIGNLNSPESIPSEPYAAEPEKIVTETVIQGSKEPHEVNIIESPETNYEPATPLNIETQSKNMHNAEILQHQKVTLAEDSKMPINPSEKRFDSPGSEDLESSEENLPEDLKEIMDLIRANGNRITQRELRKKSPYSESKVSLMLSDLEERGMVEKFKKGRGNIIRIPDEEIIRQARSQNKNESGENNISQ